MEPTIKSEPAQENINQSVQPIKKVKKISFKTKFIIIHTIAVIIVGGLVGAYLWRNDQANQQKTADALTIKTLEEEANIPIELAKRDTERKNDLSIFSTALSSYMANNRGESPDVNGWDNLVNVYIDSKDFKDPLGTDYILSETALLPTVFDSNNPVIKIFRSSRCGDGDSITSSTIRSFAFQMRLENNEIYCLTN